MTIKRRQFLRLALGAGALPSLSCMASALDYPTRPVRIIVRFQAGGADDIVARVIGQWLSEHLRQAYLVENRPGASGNIATEAAVRASADGYTLLLASAANAVVYEKLNFIFLNDIAPVAGIHRSALVVVVNPTVPTSTIPEFIAYAKANPGKISMASPGFGTPNQMAGELFKMMTGVDVQQVQYRGGAPAVADLVGGQVEIMFAVMGDAIEYIRAGKLRPLAVTTKTRSETLPDIPTVADFLPGFEASYWAGVAAPKNTPVEIVETLNKEINRALADPTIKRHLGDLGASVFSGSSADFGRLIADDSERWTKVIKLTGIKVD
jgi:tripartite-type tricarboxylate transporter receptor subunit TctC